MLLRRSQYHKVVYKHSLLTSIALAYNEIDITEAITRSILPPANCFWHHPVNRFSLLTDLKKLTSNRYRITDLGPTGL